MEPKNKIKFRGLEENLPRDTELYDYLSNKDETMLRAIPGSELYEKTIATTRMTRVAGRAFDTAQALHMISDIPQSVLEDKISSFIYKHNKALKLKDPITWKKKYGAHKERIMLITIGRAAHNIDGVIKAIQPTPSETAKVYSQG